MKKTILLGAAALAVGPMTALERNYGRFMRAPDHPPAPSASLQTLRSQRAGLVDQMRAMHTTAEADGGRDFTAEELTAYDALAAQKVVLDARIKRLEGLEADEAEGSRIIGAASRGAGIGAGGRGPEAKREFETMGEFLSAVRFNPNDQRLNFVEGVGAESGDEFSAEMRMDNQTSGGFMIPPQLRQTIMQVEPQDALVRPRANVIEAGTPPDAGITMPALDQSGTNPGNVFGGVQVSWVEEGGEKPETDADLGSVTLTPHEVAGFVTVTDKFLRNWQAASAFLEKLLRGAVTQAEDYAFVRGDGIAKPVGALNAGATYWLHRALANHVGYDDLVGMVARLLMRGGTSAIWSMPQAALPDIAKMTDPEGHYIWQPNARDGFAGQLLGYPVRWNNRMPGLGTKGDILLADWSQYLIKDGSGPFVATSEHVKFTSNKTLIKIFWNVDGAPWLNAPFVEENGYQVSPFVGLDVP